MHTPVFVDPHSAARPGQCRLTHLDLHLTTDFGAQRLDGVAEWHLALPHTDILWLDTDRLHIHEVWVDDQPCAYQLHPPLPVTGSALEISLSPTAQRVRIRYSTAPEAPALQWLSPAQTAGGTWPLLFTQSECIMARSWVPCQDTPSVRFSYQAVVTVPAGMMALMSATNPQDVHPEGVYAFEQPHPIPSYLLALAVGHFGFAPVGTRTGVYAEPVHLAAAVAEFGEMQAMLERAEALYGPYRWGRYDVLLMPPSFPFGGMENPCLTFASNTIIAGDRSLTSLIAHELAHSWSGNLVTNATWNDFWLNEGFTVYFELRIMEQLRGREEAEMMALLSGRDLRECLQNLGYGPMTRLKLDLRGCDPDDAVSPIAYDKGYYLLRCIEEAVGRPRWDAFLARYFETFAFQSIDTETFLAYLDEHLLAALPEARAKIQPETWIYEAGLPAHSPVVVSTLFEAVETAAAAFRRSANTADLQTDGWTFQQWLHLFECLQDLLDAPMMARLDEAFGLTRSTNNEILAQWLLLALRAGYTAADEVLDEFVRRVGRRKFIVPLYQAMVGQPGGLARAQALYLRARSGYHSLAVQTIGRIVGLLPA